MARMRLAALWWLPLICLASACSSTDATFVVQVVNNTSQPLSAGLIKSGGQVGQGWASPEQIAINAPQLMPRRWGTLVPPKGKVIIGPQTGPFEAGSHAVLRVYMGDVPISGLVAYGRSDPGRVDLALWPGKSGFIIETVDGRLEAKAIEEPRVGEPAAPQNPK